jgi:hypothetical protein
MEQIVTEEKEVAAPGPIGSGALQSNRIMPCEPAPAMSDAVAGEPTIVIHEDEEGETGKKRRKHTPCNPLVYEAMRVLNAHDYIPCRLISETVLPINIVALKKTEVLLILVIRSRKPVPDAGTLRRLYTAKVNYLCALSKPSQYKIMIWVNSPLCGWRYYWVNPGGLGYDWDFAKMMEE